MQPGGVDDEPQRPLRRSDRQTYKFNADEMRVLRECNSESFYQRCLPLSVLFGGAGYIGTKSGYFKPNPRFGAAPKVVVGVVLGYFIGKFSYQAKCVEKFLQLPNSPIGDMIRQRRKGGFQETLDPGFGSGMSLSPFIGMDQSDVYSDVGPKSSLDIDTTRPDYRGLDESQRPSIDNPIYEEDLPSAQQKLSTSYEELRRQNREEYQGKRSTVYKNSPMGDLQSPLTEPQQRPMPRSEQPTYSKAPTNKYGDTWG